MENRGPPKIDGAETTVNRRVNFVCIGNLLAVGAECRCYVGEAALLALPA